MATESTTEQDAALEPEIESVVSDIFSQHPSIRKINTALKAFKTGFKNNSLPASSEIHCFLDLMNPDIALDLWPAHTTIDVCEHWYDQHGFGDSFSPALDETLRLVVSNLKERLEPESLLCVLNETLHGKSLVAKAAELRLVGSLELLLACGATLGRGSTPKSIFGGMQLENYYNSSRGPTQRQDWEGKVRCLLDLSTISDLPDEEYYASHVISCDYWTERQWPEDTINRQHKAMLKSLLRDETLWGIPTLKSDHLAWIHVSSTNAVMQKAGVIRFDMFKKRFNSSTVAPGDPYLNYREVGYWSDRRGLYMQQNVVVFPCLMLTTIGKHCASRNTYMTLRDSLTTNCSGRYSSECVVHLERTLDEAYFPGLGAAELAARNMDQIISSKFREAPAWPEEDIPILVIPQLWLWRSQNVIISAHSFTREQSGCFSGTTGSLVPLFTQSSITVQLGLLIAEFIEGFGMEITVQHDRKVPPTLDLFESRVVSVLSEVKTYVKETKRNAIDYNSEADFLHVLSDCRSELAMIQHILAQQEEILGCLLNDCRQATESQSGPLPARPKPPPNWDPVKNAHTMLKQYQKRIQKIDGDAERIEKNVQDLLNLKRAYASVQDSHAGVLLSVAAIGFAIVTVIFAPLAFLVGLFALNMQGFDRLRVKQDSGDDGTKVNIGNSASNDRDLTVNVGSNHDGVFDSAKVTGIFIGTELLTILITCSLVWLSLRWFGIDFSDFRMGREEKPRDKVDKRVKKREEKVKKEAVQNADNKDREKGKEQSDASIATAIKAWSEKLTFRRKKTTQSAEGTDQA